MISARAHRYLPSTMFQMVRVDQGLSKSLMSAIRKTAALMMTTSPHIKESETEALQSQYWTILCDLAISFLSWHGTNKLLLPTATCVQSFSQTDVQKNAQVAAAHIGNLSTLQSLARKGVDSNPTTKHFGEPPFAAVHLSHIAIVLILTRGRSRCQCSKRIPRYLS